MKRKTPAKIQVIKNLFKDDNDYVISDGVDPETKAHFMTIWWLKNG